MDRLHPSIGVNPQRHGRPHRQVGEGHARWAIATGFRLVGALCVVVLLKRLRHLAHLAQIGGEIPIQTLFTKRPMESLDNSQYAIGKNVFARPWKS
jgi:hypothetical protein